MEIVIDKMWTQWIVFIVGTIIFYFWGKYEADDGGGFLSGIGAIIPLFFYFIFVIIWLIVFFVIL